MARWDRDRHLRRHRMRRESCRYQTIHGCIRKCFCSLASAPTHRVRSTARSQSTTTKTTSLPPNGRFATRTSRRLSTYSRAQIDYGSTSHHPRSPLPMGRSRLTPHGSVLTSSPSSRPHLSTCASLSPKTLQRLTMPFQSAYRKKEIILQPRYGSFEWLHISGRLSLRNR